MERGLVLGIVTVMTIAAIFFLGSGLTGYVFSETCCMGPSCSPENLCDVAKPHLEQPSAIGGNTNIYIGMIIIIAMGLFLVLTYEKLILRDKRKD